jgi:hypothetical protein
LLSLFCCLFICSGFSRFCWYLRDGRVKVLFNCSGGWNCRFIVIDDHFNL